MALSKRTQKFIADARKKQGDFGKRRKAVRNRIGPMTESESKAYSSPSKNVPKQGKKSYDNIPVTTQLDMMRRSVQRYDRRDFDNKRFAQGLAGQKSVTSPQPKKKPVAEGFAGGLAGQKSVTSPRPRVRKPNPIQMGTGPNAPKREPSKKKGAMQRFLEGKGAIGRKKGGKTSRRRGPFG
jgi:hypothetical protein